MKDRRERGRDRVRSYLRSGLPRTYAPEMHNFAACVPRGMRRNANRGRETERELTIFTMC